MKGLTMLTVVMNALVQQEKMVTVITCFYYVFEFTEFPRTGMCTAQNSSTNQGPRAGALIHIMHTRHMMSSIFNTRRNEGFKVSLVCSQATYCPK